MIHSVAKQANNETLNSSGIRKVAIFLNKKIYLIITISNYSPLHLVKAQDNDTTT